MSILADRSTRVLVQGATGSAGRRQLRALAEFGTPAVAGVTPGRGDTTVDDVAIFDTVAEAVAATGATASIVHVPPRDRAATGAALEAIEAGLDPVVLVTEGVPVHETLEIVEHARAAGTTLVGPNCVGAIVPGSALLGMLPPGCTTPGRVGLISKSGSLAIEMLRALTGAGIGQSTAVSIGGDPVLGTSQARYLELFEADPDTDAVLVLGEIGGTMEAAAAEQVARMRTPVVAFIAGRTAPPGRRMGHLGALSSSGADSAAGKEAALAEAGAVVVPTLWAARDALRELTRG
ncbi:MAG: succinate--CoA ligase subunit alpha [Pseudonocardiales bacterium]|jgi:succinyl-CoA synthetase alpha subunit|nr:succinate--CoA ligase subunit alpha [Pseudonocardiales bacterium]